MTDFPTFFQEFCSREPEWGKYGSVSSLTEILEKYNQLKERQKDLDQQEMELIKKLSKVSSEKEMVSSRIFHYRGLLSETLIVAKRGDLALTKEEEFHFLHNLESSKKKQKQTKFSKATRQKALDFVGDSETKLESILSVIPKLKIYNSSLKLLETREGPEDHTCRVQEESQNKEFTNISNLMCGASISTYPWNQEKCSRFGDPICDYYSFKLFESRIIASVTDGCNWGKKVREASVLANRSFCDYLVKHQQSLETTHDAALLLLSACRKAHRKIVQSKESMWDAGTTTLIGGILLPIVGLAKTESEDCLWAFVFVSIGDCKAYHWSPKTGKFSDLTFKNRQESLSATDCGGRLGPYVGDQGLPDLRNLYIQTIQVSKGDLIFLCSDGVHDNLDPELQGKTPAQCGFLDCEESWADMTNEKKSILKVKFMTKLIGDLSNSSDICLNDLFNSSSSNTLSVISSSPSSSSSSSFATTSSSPTNTSTPITSFPSITVNEPTEEFPVYSNSNLQSPQDITPLKVTSSLIENAIKLTSSSRSFLLNKPGQKLPSDYTMYPGKMDHTTCLCFSITGEIREPKQPNKPIIDNNQQSQTLLISRKLGKKLSRKIQIFVSDDNLLMDILRSLPQTPVRLPKIPFTDGLTFEASDTEQFLELPEQYSVSMDSSLPVLEDGKKEGDPISDYYSIRFFENCALVCLTGGCGWGKVHYTASSTANRTFIDFLTRKIHNVGSCFDVGVLLMGALRKTHHILSTFQETSSTTLVGGIMIETKEDKWQFCMINIGNNKVFHYSMSEKGLKEITNEKVLEIKDYGGYVGKYSQEGQHDLSNLSVHCVPCGQEDIFLLLTDEVWNNLDPQALGKTPKEVLPTISTLTQEQINKDWKDLKDPEKQELKVSFIHSYILKLCQQTPIPEKITKQLISHCMHVTTNTRKFMETHKDKMLPSNRNEFPGVLGHLTALAFKPNSIMAARGTIDSIPQTVAINKKKDLKFALSLLGDSQTLSSLLSQLPSTPIKLKQSAITQELGSLFGPSLEQAQTQNRIPQLVSDIVAANSISTFPVNPKTKQRQNDPISDFYKVKVFENYIICAITAGSDYGTDRDLSVRANSLFFEYIEKNICTGKTFQDLGACILAGIYQAHNTCSQEFDYWSSCSILGGIVSKFGRKNPSFVFASIGSCHALGFSHNPQKFYDLLPSNVSKTGSIGRDPPMLKEIYLGMTDLDKIDILLLVSGGMMQTLDPESLGISPNRIPTISNNNSNSLMNSAKENIISQSIVGGGGGGVGGNSLLINNQSGGSSNNLGGIVSCNWESIENSQKQKIKETYLSQILLTNDVLIRKGKGDFSPQLMTETFVDHCLHLFAHKTESSSSSNSSSHLSDSKGLRLKFNHSSCLTIRSNILTKGLAKTPSVPLDQQASKFMKRCLPRVNEFLGVNEEGNTFEGLISALPNLPIKKMKLSQIVAPHGALPLFTLEKGPEGLLFADFCYSKVSGTFPIEKNARVSLNHCETFKIRYYDDAIMFSFSKGCSFSKGAAASSIITVDTLIEYMDRHKHEVTTTTEAALMLLSSIRKAHQTLSLKVQTEEFSDLEPTTALVGIQLDLVGTKELASEKQLVTIFASVGDYAVFQWSPKKRVLKNILFPKSDNPTEHGCRIGASKNEQNPNLRNIRIELAYCEPQDLILILSKGTWLNFDPQRQLKTPADVGSSQQTSWSSLPKAQRVGMKINWITQTIKDILNETLLEDDSPMVVVDGLIDHARNVSKPMTDYANQNGITSTSPYPFDVPSNLNGFLDYCTAACIRSGSQNASDLQEISSNVREKNKKAKSIKKGKSPDTKSGMMLSDDPVHRLLFRYKSVGKNNPQDPLSSITQKKIKKLAADLLVWLKDTDGTQLDSILKSLPKVNFKKNKASPKLIRTIRSPATTKSVFRDLLEDEGLLNSHVGFSIEELSPRQISRTTSSGTTRNSGGNLTTVIGSKRELSPLSKSSGIQSVTRVNSILNPEEIACGISNSTFPIIDQKTKKRAGDPTADYYTISIYSDRIFFALTDGSDWGLASQEASQRANLGFMKYLQDHMTSDFDSTSVAIHLLAALRHAHNTTIEGKGYWEVGTTTLIGGVILEQDISDSSYLLALISVGEMKAFVTSKSGRFVEIHQKNIEPNIGRIGASDEDQPDLRSLTVTFHSLHPGDLLILMNPGVYNNFDPQYLGKTPSQVGVVTATSNQWTNSPEMITAKNYSILSTLKSVVTPIIDSKKIYSIAQALMNHSQIITEPSRQFMTDNPGQKLPEDKKTFPGKMDHCSCICIRMSFSKESEQQSGVEDLNSSQIFEGELKTSDFSYSSGVEVALSAGLEFGSSKYNLDSKKMNIKLKVPGKDKPTLSKKVMYDGSCLHSRFSTVQKRYMYTII